MQVQQLQQQLASEQANTLVVVMRRYETENGVVVAQATPMMYVPHTPWQGFLFNLSEAESLGARATRAVVLRPAM